MNENIFRHHPAKEEQPGMKGGASDSDGQSYLKVLL